MDTLGLAFVTYRVVRLFLNTVMKMPQSFMKLVLRGLLFGLLGGTLSPTLLLAQVSKPSPFRVDTDIYLDDTKPPIKRTLTLFSEGLYYDFEETESGQITVVDPGRNRIVLINKNRKVKTVLDTKQIQLMVANARAQADAKYASISKSEFVKAPYGKDEAVVQNDFMEYRATTQQPSQPDMAKQYAEFADWSARLNAIYQPKLPPYLRLELNRLIAERQVLPSEVKRITRQGGRQMEASCRLIPVWQLSQDDLVKIARCGEMLAVFNDVTMEEYWTPSVAKASAEMPVKR
jgi:hypothetical protein